ncbi:MAG TPA: P1 family peptidase [Clostridia bacterium]|nr:P1 family peptidase [Clostridia bacterium]
MTQRKRIREWMEIPARFEPGERNSITDVPGVLVGHCTLKREPICTGVTVVKPHAGDPYKYPAPCAIYVGNGFGKLAGSVQVEELGTVESLIGLTNTFSVAQVLQGIIDYQLGFMGEGDWSMNVLVGETNDGGLNDIRACAVRPEHVRRAIEALGEHVEEGCVGAGAGTRCYGFKGGIGTASRVVPRRATGEEEDYVVGALVQTNFDGNLNIYGRRLSRDSDKERPMPGSCMVVVATNAPVDARQLKRIAKRGILGIAYTGSYLAHSSGDFCIAFSNREENLVDRHRMRKAAFTRLDDEQLDPLFEAAAEAVQEAVYNSLTMAVSTRSNGNAAEGFDIEAYAHLLPLRDGSARG